jgi:hypothetical protein
MVVKLHVFLTSALDEDAWLVSRCGRFILVERDTGTHCIGAGWTTEPVWTR